MIGKKLAHYEITRALGRGGMGEVFLARDEKLGREVAIKLLPDDIKNDVERRARFEREAQTVAALNHPNVVTLHAVEEAAGRPFLVMEYVAGTTLDAEVPAAGMPLDRFFDLALSLTEAVGAAHAKGITHRDLKPQNIMIDAGGRLKVLDFGLAKLFEAPVGAEEMTIPADAHATREGVIMGTAAYMSPEQAEGKVVDARSDVFSLGVLLYQMITGRQPFQGETQISTITAVLRDEPTPVLDMRPDLPRQLTRIIRRCLEKDPDRRYETARGINYDLEILREEIVSGEHERPAPKASVATPTVSGRRRKLWPALGGVGAVVVVLVGGMWLGSRDADGPTQVAVVEPPVSGKAETGDPTVVVFPFENLGPPEDAYFAAGITDEIVSSLTGIRGLRVVSRTSALHYNRAGKSMPQIALDLGVDYVLEGSVRWQRAADGTSRVRVTPQLMDANRDEQVWASRYDRAMEEIFRVQTEIADEVVKSLGVTLDINANGASERIPTEDMTAYLSYLRAREILGSGRSDPEPWFLATDLLEKAVIRDPDFHEAWVSLTKATAGLCHFDYDRTEARQAQAKAAADRAQALAPNAAYSHLAQGMYYYWGLKDYERALTSLREADRLRPRDPEITELIAYVLRRREDYAEAAEMLEEAAELSPQDPALCYHISETLAIVERYEEALDWVEKGISLGPDRAIIYTVGGWIAVLGGMPDRARELLREVPPSDSPEIAMNLVRVLFELRDLSAALREAERLPAVFEAQYQTISRDLAQGEIHRVLGQRDLAREDFTRAEAVIGAKLVEKPDASNLVAARGIALVGMGRAAEGLGEVNRSLGLFPASKDLWIQTYRLCDLAYAQMLAGQPDASVRTLGKLMKRQTDIISPALLNSTPRFDELRDRDDFKALLAAVG